jgi:hypothetical protein
VASNDNPKSTAEPVVIHKLTSSATGAARRAQIAALRGLIGGRQKKADR